MVLSRLLTRLTYEVVQGTEKVQIGKVTNDTRNVQYGSLFVCIQGFETDGHKYVEEAISRGAVAVVVEKEVHAAPDATIIKVTDTRYALAILSAAFYGYPAEKLRMIGITGTKGKTTTAWMIHHILTQAGWKCGLIGTICINTGNRIFTDANTTPESCQIQKYLYEMVTAGCDTVVMEVSSQGLKLNRVAGIPFAIGVFTNLGSDHIGTKEHKDRDEYLQCKHLLFTQCDIGIGNVDDDAYKEIFERTICTKITFGIQSKAHYQAKTITRDKSNQYFGSTYMLTIDKAETKVTLPIPGIFNIYNSMAAIASTNQLGVSIEDAIKYLKTTQIPGRMELVACTKECAIFVDYAHNAMSLESVLKMLREYEAKRIVVVFGCGGNRARDRRYEMGEVAGTNADFTIITSDNPRFEDPKSIIEDIETGMKRTKGQYQKIEDRKMAIRYAISHRKPGDVIVVAGKGHENYQEIKGIRYKMDDRRMIKEILRERST